MKKKRSLLRASNIQILLHNDFRPKLFREIHNPFRRVLTDNLQQLSESIKVLNRRQVRLRKDFLGPHGQFVETAGVPKANASRRTIDNPSNVELKPKEKRLQ